jgi:iron complex outermembrane receptor protein/vitamin B12 transporter
MLALLCAAIVTARPATAADAGVVRGVVRDPLGAAVSGARVVLKRDGRDVKSVDSDAEGAYSFDGLAEGRYQIAGSAAGFVQRVSDPVFVGPGGHVLIDVHLQLAGIETDVLVTAAATDVQTSQIGVSATVVDASTIDALGNADLLEPLRTVPGVAVVQSGAHGGATSLFVRGGASNFNKVLVDGVPANDIGGSFDFADLATTGVDSIEVLRGSNSVLYGSDAMTSVVNITTRRGRTPVPAATLSLDGGNFGTSRGEASLGGVARRLDYFADYSHLKTSNDVANSDYRNDTLATRVGVALGSKTQVAGTFRLIDTDTGSPNSVSFYGISDDSRLKKTTTYTSVSAQTQLTDRWQSTIRFGLSDQRYHSVNPAPTGTPSDSSAFANYLGNVVTITGANGYSVTGQAILDYSGTYPSSYDATALRSLVQGQTSYTISNALSLSGGARVEHEKGTAVSSFSTTEKSRDNYGAFAEARASVGAHVFVTGGAAVDHNEVFGSAVSPRLSVAAYLRPPTPASAFGDTKVTFNAGKGIKEPSVSEELSSLSGLIPAATASTLGVTPVGPERSRTIDAGVEQGLAGGHGRVRVAYYNNEYRDLLEYVSNTELPQLGVPAAIATASGYGAYVNAQSNRARGVELSGEAIAGPLKIVAAYTYADAIVTQSFGSGALFPAENPKFPGILIGQYSPLVGARPFRRPANSGNLVVSYTHAKASVALAGYFFGKQDDSTFLSDAFFGYSMLLPNKDMDPAYQKFNLSASYQLHPRARAYITVENLFDRKFEAAAGYPALPRAVRAGMTFSLGGR